MPGLHVYHYNHYEPTSVDHLTELHETRQEAVGRLMGRFATREDEVDDLFRRGVFVDLYRVVRQGIRAGVESYSIKRLEPLCGYARQVDLRDATAQPDRVRGRARGRDGGGRADRQRVVAGYNEDDCRATLALRDWLEERRVELAARLRPRAAAPCRGRGSPLRPKIRSSPGSGRRCSPTSRTTRRRGRPSRTRRRCSPTCSIGTGARHKPAWWRYFYLRGLGPAELIDEPDALGGLTGGDVVGEVKRSVVRRFPFPPQEHRFAAGDTAHDSVTDKGWTVVAVDDALGVIDLKIGNGYDGPLPVGPGPRRAHPDPAQRERLRDLGIGWSRGRRLRARRGYRPAAAVPPGRRRRAGRAAAPTGRDRRRGGPAGPGAA